MFVWDLSSQSKIFHSYGDVTISGEGLQIFTFALHLWPLSSEGSNIVMRGIHLYWSSPRTRDTQTCCQAFSSGAVTTCFYYLGVSRVGFEHPTFSLQGICQHNASIYHNAYQNEAFIFCLLSVFCDIKKWLSGNFCSIYFQGYYGDFTDFSKEFILWYKETFSQLKRLKVNGRTS